MLVNVFFGNRDLTHTSDFAVKMCEFDPADAHVILLRVNTADTILHIMTSDRKMKSNETRCELPNNITQHNIASNYDMN